MTKRILFVCIHNSARSQMAEAFVNHHCGAQYTAHSAGLEPGRLNPVAVEVMRERGIDISGHATKSVDDLRQTSLTFDYVVTVCDGASAERCPMFPGAGKRLHWGLPDPSALTGDREEKLARTRDIRDQIEAKVKEWCGLACNTQSQCFSPTSASDTA